ncbi:hypothetical protein [Methanoculleus chikugoensis]|uniref:hypothetical protein n=1 Tax=Methanoculleus chikugoensis TaxID=118126 RepID=UPI001FB3C59B|nr:hypothetical protein [Methanoculleus chikugoensis]
MTITGSGGEMFTALMDDIAESKTFMTLLGFAFILGFLLLVYRRIGGRIAAHPDRFRRRLVRGGDHVLPRPRLHPADRRTRVDEHRRGLGVHHRDHGAV